MLPNDTFHTFNTLTEPEFRSLITSVERDVAAKVADLARKGNLGSGSAPSVLARIAAQVIPVIASISLNQLNRCLVAMRVSVSAESKEAVYEYLAETVIKQADVLREILRENSLFKNTHPLAISAAHKIVDDAQTYSLKKLRGEIDLLAYRTESAKSEGSGSLNLSPHFIINGPVGLLQTGASNFGVVTQNIDAGAREALDKALTQLIDELHKQPLENAQENAEVKEIASEAKTELQKEKPNTTKIKAILAGIGSTLSVIPKLKQSYDAIKWAASLIGLTLP